MFALIGWQIQNDQICDSNQSSIMSPSAAQRLFGSDWMQRDALGRADLRQVRQRRQVGSTWGKLWYGSIPAIESFFFLYDVEESSIELLSSTGDEA